MKINCVLLLLALGLVSSCSPPQQSAKPAPPQASPQSQPFVLEEATVADLQKRMETGQDTARSLAEKYIERIDAIDKQGPALHSVLEINPDALSIADQLDAERKAKGPRGPLHGIPVLIKDNIATADRMNTTAGSIALEGSAPLHDAFVVTRLRAAGAVILGKTNLSEWANFRSTRSTSGWSGRGGQTKNPYALDRNPSGSSSGSAVAAAANLCALAVGTETDGSIVSPASVNGLVGIKPTLGLVSRNGIIPIAHSQDTAGPMTRTVTDAAILLGALTGADPSDAITKNAVTTHPPDYRQSLDANGLKGARIGIVRKKLMGYHPGTDALVEKAIAELKRLGAVVVDPADLPTIDKFENFGQSTEMEVLLYEFKADLNAYLGGLGPNAKMHSLADIIAFDEQSKDREMPFFGQEIMLRAQAKGPLTDQAYLAALKMNGRLSRAEGIDAVMDKLKLDALVAPTSGPAWPTDPIYGDREIGTSSTMPAIAGFPHITVPAGDVFGLPVGLSFFGRAWSEPTLIRLAYAYEQGTKHRKPPKMLPTVTISVR